MDRQLDPRLQRIVEDFRINSFPNDGIDAPGSNYFNETQLDGFRYQPSQLRREEKNLDDFDRYVLQGDICPHPLEAENGRARMSLGLRRPDINSDISDPHDRQMVTRPMLSHYREPVSELPYLHQYGSRIQPEREQSSFRGYPEPTGVFHGASRFSGMQPQGHLMPSIVTGGVFTPPQQSRQLSSPTFQSSSPTQRVSLRREARRPQSYGGGGKQLDDLFNEERVSSATSIETSMPDKMFHSAIERRHAPPTVQGIQLVSPHDLPDRFRQVFPYKLFNAVQSKCFAPIYMGNDNVVISAPTGSGKTAILELAICRLLESLGSGQFKIVYQAPTKSLCSERVRDWQKKFSMLNLPCAELTGDTDASEMKKVGNATIIVTTPEKWDSITRKWKDYIKLLQMVKLFLIDEVHILKDTRGATLEAVVSRMKSIGANVRFVALSATVPNSQDVAIWLGRDHTNGHLPAHRELFGEEFRPVKLQKHVYGYDSNGNDFSFDAMLDSKLTAAIAKHTQKKPMLVFCFTRKSCENTAAKLAEWWASQRLPDRAWPAPNQTVAVLSKELQSLLPRGVAFHHAGLDAQDRMAIETAFLKGEVNVICCTSTLAVGINLPCHLVVIKGTICFQDGGLAEYSDLEVMQMLGRAGRPQFDQSAIAIIMTRSNKVDRYQKMMSGQEILESTLHLNLIEHLNSEIGLGTVHDIHSAKQWLAGTFLSVRMRENPNHYKFNCDNGSRDPDERLEQVCERDMKLLQDARLITEDQRFACTEYGEAMSRYMVKFETIKLLLGVPEQAKISQILLIISQAVEFKDLRMKANERPVFREFNKSPLIKFPFKEAIETYVHKVSLIIQIQLGGVDLPTDQGFASIRRQFQAESNIVFERVQRLIRCVIDCKAYDCDLISTRNALELARAISAGYWENSPLQLRQIGGIGPVAARKLIQADIFNVESLAAMDTMTIERVMSRNPPFGRKILDSLVNFPRLSLAIEIVGKVLKSGQQPKLKIKARLGFSNSKVPYWNNRMPSVTFVAGVSSGTLVHFWRGNIKKLDKGFEIAFFAELITADDSVCCTLACDELVGTVQTALLTSDVPASAFPPRKEIKATDAALSRPVAEVGEDIDAEYEWDDIEDGELLAAAEGVEAQQNGRLSEAHTDDDFENIDEFEDNDDPSCADDTGDSIAHSEPVQMANGRWQCNHLCRNEYITSRGVSCKHACCRVGLDKPRKLPRKKQQKTSKDGHDQEGLKQGHHAVKAVLPRPRKRPLASNMAANFPPKKKTSGRMQLKATADSELNYDEIEMIDLAEDRPSLGYAELGPRDYRKLHQLHSKIQTNDHARLPKQKHTFSYEAGSEPDLPFLRVDSPLHTPEAHLRLGVRPDNGSDADIPSPSALSPYYDMIHDSYNQAYCNEPNATHYPTSDQSLNSIDTGKLSNHDAFGLQIKTPKPSEDFENAIIDYGSSGYGLRINELGWTSSKVMNSSPEMIKPGSGQNEVASVGLVGWSDPEVEHQVDTGKEERVEECETQEPTPEWLKGIDADLFREFAGIVDFI